MKKHFLYFVFICIVLLNLGCKKSPTEPNPDNTQPGRRDYVWSVDTISTDPFVYIRRFWGSSSNDIWAVSGNLFHYDGEKWMEVKTNISIYPEVIFGFSQSNIWAAGYNKIWHFNGTSWNLYSEHSIAGFGTIFFDNIWGNSPNNIYAVGYASGNSNNSKGVIMHYDGVKWDFLNIPVMKINFTDIRSVNSNLILEGLINENLHTTTKLYQFDGTTFDELYSGDDYPKLTFLKDRLFIKIEKKIFKYYQGKLELFIDFSGTEYWDGFWGRTEKDFFCVTGDGLGHYNGTDLVTIYPFDINKLSPFSEMFFDKEVFFLGRDEQANMSIVIKGKLTN